MAPKNQSMMDRFVGGRHKEVTLKKRLPITAKEYAEAKLMEIARKEAAINLYFVSGDWPTLPLSMRKLNRSRTGWTPGATEITADRKTGNLTKPPRVMINKFYEEMWKTDPVEASKSLDYTLTHEAAHVIQATRGGFRKSQRQVPWRYRHEEKEANEYAQAKTGMAYEEYNKLTEGLFMRTRMRQIKKPLDAKTKKRINKQVSIRLLKGS